MVADVMHPRSQMQTVLPIFSTIPVYKRFPTKFKENQKKIYYCQRCLNHDTPRPRKNHKCECPYADCTCEKCGLVEKRRILNIRLQNYNTTIELPNDNPTLENEFDSKLIIDDDDDKKTKGG